MVEYLRLSTTEFLPLFLPELGILVPPGFCIVFEKLSSPLLIIGDSLPIAILCSFEKVTVFRFVSEF